MAKTLRELAFTLECRRCGAKPETMCSIFPRTTKLGTRYYVFHRVRYDDARRFRIDPTKPLPKRLPQLEDSPC